MHVKLLMLSSRTGLAVAMIAAGAGTAAGQLPDWAEQNLWVLESALVPTVLPEESLSIPLPVESVRLDPQYGRAPLHFERNDGQVDEEVKYLTRGRGYTLFLTGTEAVIVLQMRSAECGMRNGDALASARSADNPKSAIPVSEPLVLRMSLVGANPSPSIRGKDELRGKVNYFIGNDASHWRTNIATFAKVRYEEVYPGIDLVYYGNEGQLEYDFVVAPGADPNRIALEFDGAEELKLDEGGDLIVRVGGQEVRWRKPLVYQQVNGARREIAGSYRLGARVTEQGTRTLKFVSFELVFRLINDWSYCLGAIFWPRATYRHTNLLGVA